MNEEEQIRSTGMCSLARPLPTHLAVAALACLESLRCFTRCGAVETKGAGAKCGLGFQGAWSCVGFDPAKLASNRRMEIDGRCCPDLNLAQVGT
jgi:hypothetical protein